jgi:hypothetical protein
MWEWRRSRKLVSRNARKHAWTVGPAESSVFHYFARRGPTKEAHRRALSGASDQPKRPKAGCRRSPPPGEPIRGGVGGPIRGGIRGPLRGPIRGETEGTRDHCRAVRRAGPNCIRGIARRGRPGAEICLGAAGDSAPGRVRPMPSPGGNTRPDKHRRQGRSSSAADADQLGRPERPVAACGRSSLTPGRAGWSRGHAFGRSALRAAAPPGEGAARQPSSARQPSQDEG